MRRENPKYISYMDMNKMCVNCTIPLMLLLVLFTSCSKRYKIEGKSSVTSLDGKMLYLKSLQEGDWVTVDSAEVIHGLFKMKGPADSVRMVTLYMGDEGLMPLVLEMDIFALALQIRRWRRVVLL